MKKYLWLIVIVIGGIFSYKTFADEVKEKTDGSFVGEHPPKPINSFFVGNISKSKVNDSFVGEDVHKRTDALFVGSNTINPDNSYFAGDTYKQHVGNATVAPFAQENSPSPKDGVFIGQDVEKKTDGRFVGSNYGK